MVGFAKERARDGLVCIAEVRVAVIECIGRASTAINMLIELSLVLKCALLNSPATINAASGYMIF